MATWGLLSLDNLEAIRAIRLGDQPLKFILAMPGRRYGDFEALLSDVHQQVRLMATEGIVGELEWQGFRLVVAHQPVTAVEQGQARDENIAALTADAAKWAGKPDGQVSGKTYRGKKLSDSGTTARIYKAVSDAHLANIVKVDLSADLFTYVIDERALKRARMMDGKLILITNMPDHSPTEIVARHKVPAYIELGFRVLKSEIVIAQVFHRLPNRIRVHALFCFLALVLYRVLRMRLKARDNPLSPERALEIVRRIRFHQITLHQRRSASGLATMTQEQKDLFETIEMPALSDNSL